MVGVRYQQATDACTALTETACKTLTELALFRAGRPGLRVGQSEDPEDQFV